MLRTRVDRLEKNELRQSFNWVDCSASLVGYGSQPKYFTTPPRTSGLDRLFIIAGVLFRITPDVTSFCTRFSMCS